MLRRRHSDEISGQAAANRWALAAVGIASGMQPDAALERAEQVMGEWGTKVPTLENMRAIFDEMTRDA